MLVYKDLNFHYGTTNVRIPTATWSGMCVQAFIYFSEFNFAI